MADDAHDQHALRGGRGSRRGGEDGIQYGLGLEPGPPRGSSRKTLIGKPAALSGEAVRCWWFPRVSQCSNVAEADAAIYSPLAIFLDYGPAVHQPCRGVDFGMNLRRGGSEQAM